MDSIIATIVVNLYACFAQESLMLTTYDNEIIKIIKTLIASLNNRHGLNFTNSLLLSVCLFRDLAQGCVLCLTFMCHSPAPICHRPSDIACLSYDLLSCHNMNEDWSVFCQMSPTLGFKWNGVIHSTVVPQKCCEVFLSASCISFDLDGFLFQNQ